MDESRWRETKHLSSKLRILASADPTNPTQRAGVTIVLNKTLIDTDNIIQHEIIPGQAILVTLNWSRKTKLTILTVYAPNPSNNNTKFWEDLQNTFTQNPRLSQPKAMLGDLNMVEDAIDRLPIHEERGQSPETLRGLKCTLQL